MLVPANLLGQTLQLVEGGGQVRLRQGAPDNPSALPHLFLIGAALFRRSVFARIGGFDEGKRFSEDLDWFIRARESQVQVQLLSKPTLIKRCHANNMTHGKSVAEMGLAAVLHASLARRRQDSGAAKPMPHSHP